MKNNDIDNYPNLINRILSVWYRHYKVYTKYFIANGLPPFLEPLIFLAAIGLGLSKYIFQMSGIPYIEFLATGLIATNAMFTAAFECSFGTYIRLEFDKVYDGMLAAPINVNDLLLGEIFWAGTKGFFFSGIVSAVVCIFGVLHWSVCIYGSITGFFTATMFACLSLFITSFIKNINQFNFYFTGFLSPMFFFSGIIFDINNLPKLIQPLSEIFPLTHSVRIIRFLYFSNYNSTIILDISYILIFILIFGFFAIRRLKKRLIQ